MQFTHSGPPKTTMPSTATDQTPNLALPYLIAAQAQKHVTLNESLRALDAIVHLAVLDRGLATSPATPSIGERWIVASAPTSAWSGRADQIAATRTAPGPSTRPASVGARTSSTRARAYPRPGRNGAPKPSPSIPLPWSASTRPPMSPTACRPRRPRPSSITTGPVIKSRSTRQSPAPRLRCCGRRRSPAGPRWG